MNGTVQLEKENIEIENILTIEIRGSVLTIDSEDIDFEFELNDVISFEARAEETF